MLEKLNQVPSNLKYAPTGSYHLNYTSSLDGLNDWAIVCPRSIDVCIVNLHGHGSNGDQLFTRQDIRKFWLERFLALNVSILCPNLRDNAWMSPAAVDDLSQLLSHIRIQHGIQRFVFFSGSMGGTGNLIYATQRPEDVYACISLGAATDLSCFYDWCIHQPKESVSMEIAKAIEESYGCKPEGNLSLFNRHSTLENCERLTMPIFFAHGTADTLIPVEQARQLAEKMHKKQNFKYFEIPDGNHDSPLFIPEALEFLEQSCF